MTPGHQQSEQGSRLKFALESGVRPSSPWWCPVRHDATRHDDTRRHGSWVPKELSRRDIFHLTCRRPLLGEPYFTLLVTRHVLKSCYNIIAATCRLFKWHSSASFVTPGSLRNALISTQACGKEGLRPITHYHAVIYALPLAHKSLGEIEIFKENNSAPKNYALLGRNTFT